MTKALIAVVALAVVGCDPVLENHRAAADDLLKANAELRKTALEYQAVCMELREVMQSRIDRLASDSARCAEMKEKPYSISYKAPRPDSCRWVYTGVEDSTITRNDSIIVFGWRLDSIWHCEGGGR